MQLKLYIRHSILASILCISLCVADRLAAQVYAPVRITNGTPGAKAPPNAPPNIQPEKLQQGNMQQVIMQSGVSNALVKQDADKSVSAKIAVPEADSQTSDAAKGNTKKQVETLFQPVPAKNSYEPAPVVGTVDHSNFSICNPPTQPQVAAGRCQPRMVAIDCADNCLGGQSWANLHPYPFQPLAHGEYLGPIRLPSTLDYRLRVGDQVKFMFIDSPSEQLDSYRLMIGDEVAIESATDDKIRRGDLLQGRGLTIQSDGMLYASLIGPIRAEGLTVPQLRHNLEVSYKAFIREPSIDVTPIKTNSLKTAILNSVDARAGAGGQNFIDLVHPDGTVRLPKLGAVCVQGMTLDEVKREVNLRLGRIVAGLEIEPVINAEASHFIFIAGEVTNPNRFQLLGPTTVTQAIALAGGTKLGGNLREIVIFRRAEDWRLIATRVDLRGAHLGKSPSPADEIWLRDNDLVIVPKTPITLFNDFVKQVFTDGAYKIFPFNGLSLTKFKAVGGGGIN